MWQGRKAGRQEGRNPRREGRKGRNDEGRNAEGRNEQGRNVSATILSSVLPSALNSCHPAFCLSALPPSGNRNRLARFDPDVLPREAAGEREQRGNDERQRPRRCRGD